MTRNTASTRTSPGALFARAVSSTSNCVVVAAGAALAGVGAVAVVALIVPGAVHGRVLVMAH